MKYILIFNGYPSSGKTTIEKEISQQVCSIIHSSIDPIRNLVRHDFFQKTNDAIILRHLQDFGLGDEKKTQKYRQLLSNVKKTLDDFCDYSLQDCMKTAKSFMAYDDVELLMIDIREPYNIARFVTEFKDTEYYKKRQCSIATVFVRRDEAEDIYYSNDSDNNVEKFPYGFKLNNNGTLEDIRTDVVPTFLEMLRENWNIWTAFGG